MVDSPGDVMAKNLAVPTILVAQCTCGSDALVKDLQQQGYLVLEARDGAEAIEIARVHSRPIDFMLTDENEESRSLAATLKQFRPHTRVMFIARHATGGAADVLRSDMVLAKIRVLLGPPRSERAAELVNKARCP